MKLITKQFPNQVITTAVNASTGMALMDDCYALAVLTSGLTNTVAVQVEPTDTGANWTNLYSAGVVVNVQSSGCIVISPVPFRQLRFNSGAAEAASRTIVVLAQIVL